MINDIINYFEIKYHIFMHATSYRTALKVLVNLSRVGRDEDYPAFKKPSDNYQLLKRTGAVKSKPNYYRNVDSQSVDYVTDYGHELAEPIREAQNSVFSWLILFVIFTFIMSVTSVHLNIFPLTLDKIATLIVVYVFYMAIIIIWLLSMYKSVKEATIEEKVFNEQLTKFKNKVRHF